MQGTFSALFHPLLVATGKTVAEVVQQIGEAIDFHIDGMRRAGLRIPEPSTQTEYVEVGAA